MSMNLFIKKSFSVLVALLMLVTFVPQTAFAASLAAPANLAMGTYYSTNDNTPTFTWSASSGATWYQIGIDAAGWSNLGNITSYTFTSPLADGWHTFYVRARDASASVSAASSYTFEIDTKGPTVSTVSPSTATEDEAVTFYVTSSSTDTNTFYCGLIIDGTNVGSMTKSGTTFYKSYTFAWDGTYTVYAYCEDGDGNTTSGASRTVTVSNADDDTDDEETFTVPAVTPSTATEDESVTFKVTPTGDLDAEACKLYVSGVSVGFMSESSGTFSRSYTFTNDGTYTVYAYCEDENGDWTKGTSRLVRVAEADDDSDDEDFTVPAVTPSSATEDEEVTFEVIPYGDLDAESCKLYVSGSSVGTMSEDDGEFSRDYTFANDGSYTVYAYCEDENGDWTKGTSRTVKVTNEDDEDEDFSVPAVTPSTATEDESTTFKVKPTGDLDAEVCKLYVSGVSVGFMSESSGTFSRSYTFTNDGTYTVYAYCEDENGDWTKGTSRSVKVSNEDDEDEADRGSLIKTDCGSSSSVSDPCRAVYYYGKDGDRHAFPNEGTFYSWFADFDDVVEVSDEFMASLDLGDNVTYRPGSVLVKFDSSAKVYAVEAERTLRHYKSLSILESDYGDDWEEVLVSLPDTLYKNYEIGDVIDSKGDFDRTDAYYSVDSIEDIF